MGVEESKGGCKCLEGRGRWSNNRGENKADDDLLRESVLYVREVSERR